MFRYLFILACFSCLLFGCGAGEIITPGEEVEIEKWIDPVDIGKTFKVGGVKDGDIVILETGEEHTVKFPDYIKKRDGKEFLMVLAPEQENPNWVTMIEKGVAVPKGYPIVTMEFQGGGRSINSLTMFWVSVDRVLDYHLLVYVEIQQMDAEEVGGKISRKRDLFIIPKGARESPPFAKIGGEKFSASILPYIQMEEIDLPVKINPEYHEYLDPNSKSNVKILRSEDRVVLKGHKFRPYRISSPSYAVVGKEIERNW